VANTPFGREGGRYFALPPEGVTSFKDLFRFIWEMGLGNAKTGPDGSGHKWKRETLAAALDEKVSLRTIDDWRSGKGVPRDPNLRALLNLITDRTTRSAWTEKLVRAAAEGRDERRSKNRAFSDVHDEDETDGKRQDEPLAPLTPREVVVSSRARNRPPDNALQRFLASSHGPPIVGAAMALLILTGMVALDGPPRPAREDVAEAQLRVGDTFQQPFPDGSGHAPRMILLPMGSVVMGSPESEPGRDGDESRSHTVNINYRLAVSVHEVTWDDYMLCVADGACNGYTPDDAGFGRGDRPVVNLNWNDGYAYLHWLNRKLGIAWERADRYTYLTEAEWEYAAFAGTQGATFAPYQTGQSIFTDAANFNGMDLLRDSAPGRNLGATTPVGAYPANAWGLHDMHGNVWEWVEDCYRDRHTAVPNDGRAWLEGPCGARVMKGGSYADPMHELRAANRLPVRPEDRSPGFGLRLAVRLDGAWAPAQSAP